MLKATWAFSICAKKSGYALSPRTHSVSPPVAQFSSLCSGGSSIFFWGGGGGANRCIHTSEGGYVRGHDPSCGALLAPPVVAGAKPHRFSI